MATGDIQIVAAGVAPAPLDYLVPGLGEIQPKVITATVDGTGAAVPFLPIIDIISDGGVVVARCKAPVVSAGGQADVSWFPHVAPDTATNPSLPILETLLMSSRVAAGVTSSVALTAGTSYLVTVQGTYSDWNLVLDQGTPLPDAMFPTSVPGRVSTEVGLDAETLFAYPSAHPHVIGHWADFEISLDNGATWNHVEPFDGAHTTPTADHLYSYVLTGQGSPVKFRNHDTGGPFGDNYGSLQIVIYGIPAGGGGVSSLTAADTSIVVGGTATNPTVRTNTLDVIATDHPPAANWSNNSKKITSLANGTVASDAAAFGQIPTALPPNGTAGGDLAGTYPNPSVKAVTETSGPTDLTLGAIPDGDFLKRSGATIIGVAAPAAGVSSLDAITGAISLVAGSNVTISDNTPGAGQITLAATGGTGTASNSQIFTAGAGQTWSKPSGCKFVQVVCVGSGGGGGGGQNNAPVSRCGGGGGGGGSVAVATFAAGDLGNSETVNVAAGGGGGAVGSNGTPGGQTTFGVHLTASGGGAGTVAAVGAGGTGPGGGGASVPVSGTVSVNGGAPNSATAIAMQGANGSSASDGTNSEWGGAGGGGGSSTGAGGKGGSSVYGGPAGGGGGGNSGTGAAGTAGAGGTTQVYTAGGGAAQNVSGTTFLGPYCGGGGGGGQGGGGAGVATKGGDGGRGAGGGGGGTGGTGKAGGNGGDGICIVVSW